MERFADFVENAICARGPGAIDLPLQQCEPAHDGGKTRHAVTGDKPFARTVDKCGQLVCLQVAELLEHPFITNSLNQDDITEPFLQELLLQNKYQRQS